MRIFGLPQNGWVWLGGCGFGLTTLNELTPGLMPRGGSRKKGRGGWGGGGGGGGGGPSYAWIETDLTWCP